MLEDFKRLKIWVEKYPTEAAIRIEDLERKQNDYTNTLNETRRKRDEVKGKLEIALKTIKDQKRELKEAQEKVAQLRKVKEISDKSYRELLERLNR